MGISTGHRFERAVEGIYTGIKQACCSTCILYPIILIINWLILIIESKNECPFGKEIKMRLKNSYISVNLK